MTALQEAGVPAGVCETSQDRYEWDPQLRHLEWVVELEQTEIGRWPVKELPTKFSETPPYIGGVIDRHGPNYGEDNDYVLGELLGLDKEEIAEFANEGVLLGRQEAVWPHHHPPHPAVTERNDPNQMDLSIIYELETNDNSEEGIRGRYAECLEEVKLADTLGFKTVWFTEHHFLDRFSYSSAPDVWLSYLAANTKNIRLGHGIVLLPFNINHPLRVAERAAVLDLISNGRVDFGGGRAISDSELAAFNVHPDVTRPQWLESLRMLPKMWTQEEFSWDSELIKIPPRMVIPKPVQKPHPPMHVSCTQPATIEIAADNGLGVLGFGIGQDKSNDYVRMYKERIQHCTPIGEFINNRFCMMAAAMCAPTDKEALDIRGPDFTTYNEAVQQLFTPWLGKCARLVRLDHGQLGEKPQRDPGDEHGGHRRCGRGHHRQSGYVHWRPQLPRRSGR